MPVAIPVGVPILVDVPTAVYVPVTVEVPTVAPVSEGIPIEMTTPVGVPIRDAFIGVSVALVSVSAAATGLGVAFFAHYKGLWCFTRRPILFLDALSMNYMLYRWAK